MNGKEVGDTPLSPLCLCSGEELHFLRPREGGLLDCWWTALQGHSAIIWVASLCSEHVRVHKGILAQECRHPEP